MAAMASLSAARSASVLRTAASTASTAAICCVRGAGGGPASVGAYTAMEKPTTTASATPSTRRIVSGVALMAGTGASEGTPGAEKAEM